MTIVCGTDFSQNALAATRAAGAIARRLAVRLELVHVTPEADPALAAQLATQAGQLASQFGITVEPVIELGVADERLVALASSGGARLLVVGSLGARKQHRWLLGSVAERVAQVSPVPVLVVRDGVSLEAWAQGEKALRVMVGVELAATSKAALRWAQALHAIAPCELRVAQVVWPPEAHHRTGVAAPIPLDQLRPELEEKLLLELKQWAGEQPGQTEFLVKAGWGRVDNHLTTLAAESNADLLVVGTHQRAGVARLWQGSVSRGVLHSAGTNVACVPSPETSQQ